MDAPTAVTERWPPPNLDAELSESAAYCSPVPCAECAFVGSNLLERENYDQYGISLQESPREGIAAGIMCEASQFRTALTHGKGLRQKELYCPSKVSFTSDSNRNAAVPKRRHASAIRSLRFQNVVIARPSE
jgi:hypothetical protein